MGHALYAAGLFEKSLDAFQKAGHLPGVVSVLEALGRFEEALQIARDEEPNNPGYWVKRQADILERLGQNQEAVAILDHAQPVKEKDALQLLVTKARVQFTDGDYVGARNTLQEMIGQYPDSKESEEAKSSIGNIDQLNRLKEAHTS